MAAGALHAVAQSLKALVTRDPDAQILIVDDASGSQVDLNLHGRLAQVLQRLPRAAAQAMPVPAPAPARMAGRPKLGVVAREITLLPRHWAWLATQPGGASVALRKRVEHAQRGSKAQDEQRQARDAAYQPTSRGLPVPARAGRRCPRFRRGQPRPVRRGSWHAYRNGQTTCARTSCSWPNGDGPTPERGLTDQTPVLPVVSGASSALCRFWLAEPDW